MDRKEYLELTSAQWHHNGDSMPAHRAYYAQWVTPQTIAYVVASIGSVEIDSSTDPHMNDIALRRWDVLRPPLAAKVTDFGKRGFSLSDWVCVSKEAARQHRERHVACQAAAELHAELYLGMRDD